MRIFTARPAYRSSYAPQAKSSVFQSRMESRGKRSVLESSKGVAIRGDDIVGRSDGVTVLARDKLSPSSLAMEYHWFQPDPNATSNSCPCGLLGAVLFVTQAKVFAGDILAHGLPSHQPPGFTQRTTCIPRQATMGTMDTMSIVQGSRSTYVSNHADVDILLSRQPLQSLIAVNSSSLRIKISTAAEAKMLRFQRHLLTTSGVQEANNGCRSIRHGILLRWSIGVAGVSLTLRESSLAPQCDRYKAFC